MKQISFPERDRGFTLVEVMVAFTILGFVLLMIFGVIRLALSAWHKGEEIQEVDQQIRIGEQFLLRQIKSTAPYKIKSTKAEGNYLLFEGTAESLKFISTYSLRQGRAAGLVMVTYEFRKNESGEGSLFLTERKVLNKDLLEEPSGTESAIPLLNNLKELRLAYYKEEDISQSKVAEWVEDWTAKERQELPAAVRLTLTYGKSLDKGNPNQISLVVIIPASRWEEIKIGPSRRIIPQRPVG